MNGVPLAKETTGGEWDERKYQSALIRRPGRNYFDVFYSAYENASPNLHRIGRGKLHWTDGDDTGNLHGYVGAGSGSRYLNIEDTFLRVRSGDGAAGFIITSDTDDTDAGDDPRIHFQHGATPATKVTMGYDSSADTFIIARSHLGNNIGITIDSTGQVTVGGGIGGLEKSADPAEPAEGEFVIWMSDGTGKGDDGDVLIASKAGGATKWTTLLDHSGGAGW